MASKGGRFWNSVQDSEQLVCLAISMTSWQPELAGVRPYWERPNGGDLAHTGAKQVRAGTVPLIPLPGKDLEPPDCGYPRSLSLYTSNSAAPGPSWPAPCSNSGSYLSAFLSFMRPRIRYGCVTQGCLSGSQVKSTPLPHCGIDGEKRNSLISIKNPRQKRT